MDRLAKLLRQNELWLMCRIRDYAVERGFSRYTSTLEEAWRISIVGLTDSMAAALAISTDPWELSPDETYLTDPIAAFGVLEAQKHRSRGVTLEMFMGLMKYYRQAYLDLLRTPAPCPRSPRTAGPDADRAAGYARFIERAFDRIEIAFCAEWTRHDTINRAIDELQDANRRMTNEKNKFLTLFESLPTAVFLLDDCSRILHMNHAAAQMLDPAANSGGHYYSQAEDRIPFPWFGAELLRFRATGDEKEYEHLLELPDGNQCRVLARFRPMLDISFKFPGTVVILQDITERKKVEEELKQAQEFLIQQEKMASIGQLAAGVAHEINNPVGYIISNLSTLGKYVDRLTGYIAVLEERLSGAGMRAETQLAETRSNFKIDYIAADAKELIHENLDGAHRVRSIVQDLKSFSRVDQADCSMVNLNHTLETAINIAWNEIKYVASVEREFGDIPEIRCYPQQLNQVFLNLLINAAQAIEGEGTITVRTRSDATGIQVVIDDTGKGIPETVMPRIFEPFFTTKEVGKGTGLGLSVSYGIVRKHGGEIAVRSQVGKGSSFAVRLPFSGLDREGNGIPTG